MCLPGGKEAVILTLFSFLFPHPPCFGQSSTYEHQTAKTSDPAVQLDVLSKQTAFKNGASRFFLGFKFDVRMCGHHSPAHPIGAVIGGL